MNAIEIGDGWWEKIDPNRLLRGVFFDAARGGGPNFMRQCRLSPVPQTGGDLDRRRCWFGAGSRGRRGHHLRSHLKGGGKVKP